MNTKAVFFLSQAVARHMLQQGEIVAQHRSIINITSSNAVAVSISRAILCFEVRLEHDDPALRGEARCRRNRRLRNPARNHRYQNDPSSQRDIRRADCPQRPGSTLGLSRRYRSHCMLDGRRPLSVYRRPSGYHRRRSHDPTILGRDPRNSYGI
jgi:NAD(P)-dependent dehydrogenase (short-subunit alcohol dehydrogenase family)